MAPACTPPVPALGARTPRHTCWLAQGHLGTGSLSPRPWGAREPRARGEARGSSGFSRAAGPGVGLCLPCGVVIVCRWLCPDKRLLRPGHTSWRSQSPSCGLSRGPGWVRPLSPGGSMQPPRAWLRPSREPWSSPHKMVSLLLEPVRETGGGFGERRPRPTLVPPAFWPGADSPFSRLRPCPLREEANSSSTPGDSPRGDVAGTRPAYLLCENVWIQLPLEITT